MVEKLNSSRELPQEIRNACFKETLVKDLIFVFQGIDGHNIFLSKIEDAYIIKSTIPINNPTRKLTEKLAEMGWLFRKVNDFINENSGVDKGQILQSLCCGLK